MEHIGKSEHLDACIIELEGQVGSLLPKDTTRRIAKAVAEAKYEDVPTEHYEILKKSIVDVYGAMIAGCEAAAVPELLALAKKKWGGAEEAGVAFYDFKCPAHNAAYINAVMARALDYEDNEENGSHPTGSIWPAIMAASQLVGGISGKEALLAFAVGRDVEARLNLANKRYDGFDPVTTAVLFGSTAAVGKIMRLSEDQMVDAFGIALNEAGGTWQSNADSALTVRMNNGQAARNAILSCEFAGMGLTGAHSVFEGVYGYFHLFAHDLVLPDILLDGLGTKYLGARINFKRWPSCGQTSAATDLALQLVADGLDYHNIESIHVRQSPSGYNLAGKDFEAGPNISVSTQFCAQYCIANSLVRKHPTLEQFNNREVALDPEVVAFCKKITTAPDPSFLEMDIEVDPNDPLAPVLKNRGKYLRVEFDITLKNGDKFTEALDYPLSMNDIIEKYRDSVMFIPGAITTEDSEKLLESVLHLEDVDDFNTLFDCLKRKASL